MGQSAENDVPSPIGEDVLDKTGDWEIRVTVYRNGRRVGTCDTTGWETYAAAAYWAAEGLSTRELDMHRPRRRTRVIPPASGGGAP